MATINGEDLGIVQTENSVKDSNLFFEVMPTYDSDEAILIDIMGAGRTINLSGKVTGEKATLMNFVETIEGIQNGQQNPVEYVGEIITKQVMIDSFNWEYKEGSPNELSYTLVLKEGGL